MKALLGLALLVATINVSFAGCKKDCRRMNNECLNDVELMEKDLGKLIREAGLTGSEGRRMRQEAFTVLETLEEVCKEQKKICIEMCKAY